RHAAALRRRLFELRTIAGEALDEAIDQVARAGMRDVLHDGRDIDDAAVALQHPELEVVEIQYLHLFSPCFFEPAGSLRRRDRRSLYRFVAVPEPACFTRRGPRLGWPSNIDQGETADAHHQHSRRRYPLRDPRRSWPVCRLTARWAARRLCPA